MGAQERTHITEGEVFCIKKNACECCATGKKRMLHVPSLSCPRVGPTDWLAH